MLAVSEYEMLEDYKEEERGYCLQALLVVFSWKHLVDHCAIQDAA